MCKKQKTKQAVAAVVIHFIYGNHFKNINTVKTVEMVTLIKKKKECRSLTEMIDVSLSKNRKILNDSHPSGVAESSWTSGCQNHLPNECLCCPQSPSMHLPGCPPTRPGPWPPSTRCTVRERPKRPLRPWAPRLAGPS